MKTRKILLSAYACEPGKGSEPGIGWHWALELAGLGHDVWVLTRANIRSDNGPEFTGNAVREWLSRIGVKTLFTKPGSPWKKGYNESFNGKFRDELLNTEIFWTLEEAKVLIGKWRQHYNTVRPHSSLGYCLPTGTRGHRHRKGRSGLH